MEEKNLGPTLNKLTAENFTHFAVGPLTCEGNLFYV